MFIQYTPTRGLIGGSDGKLEADLQTYDRVPLIDAKQHKAMSGKSVTVLRGTRQEYSLRTCPIDEAEEEKWEEFQLSVSAGEPFTIDITGTEASPDNPVTAKLEARSFKASRFQHKYRTFSFKVGIG